MIDALDILCAQLMLDLFAIAKFLLRFYDMTQYDHFMRRF